MSRPIVLLCICAALSWTFVSADVLVPPKGYSVAFTGTIRKGVQKYECIDGSWTKTGSSASVYTPLGVKLGPHWSVYDPKERTYTYFWNIINSHGGTFESGIAIGGLEASPVKTVQVSPSAVESYLSLVTVHRGAGDADQVAFVSLTDTSDGLPPSDSCSSGGEIVKVSFGGTYTFYSQDRVPPVVPSIITPPGTFVQTMFLSGTRMYRFDGGEWKFSGFSATITEVAGGYVIGKVETFIKPDEDGSSLALTFNAPNAYVLNGFTVDSVKMYAEGCPWQLLKITALTGYLSPLGIYKYALIAATYGGNPPAIEGKIDGMELGSDFTGQCYLYT